MMDTFWYIDPDAGVNGEVIQNSLATGPAEYNDDFSEMTVHLRDGIYWSDGEKFMRTTSSTPSKPRSDHAGDDLGRRRSRPRSKALTHRTT